MTRWHAWRCRTYQPLLVDYVDGGLEQPQHERLEAHVARCERCRADLTALRELPPLLHASPVPDPGEAFWLQQRQAISRATRNLPAPRSGWNLEWLHNLLHVSPWRYPVAVAASFLLAVCVYRFAERTQTPQPGIPALQIAALDADSLLALHDLMRAVVPTDELLPRVASDDETLLAALPLSEVIGAPAPPEAPGAADLTDSELEGAEELIGGVG